MERIDPADEVDPFFQGHLPENRVGAFLKGGPHFT